MIENESEIFEGESRMSSGGEVVAVAVAEAGSSSSERAVLWALNNLNSHSNRFLLIHVAPVVNSVFAPSEKCKEIDQIQRNAMKLKSENVFLSFKKLCKTREVDTLLLNDDNPAFALLKYLAESGTRNLVLGRSSMNRIMRTLNFPDMPSHVLNSAPENCNIFVVMRGKVIKHLAKIPVSIGADKSYQDHHSSQVTQSLDQDMILDVIGDCNIDELKVDTNLELKDHICVVTEVLKPIDNESFHSPILLSDKSRVDSAFYGEENEEKEFFFQECNEIEVTTTRKASSFPSKSNAQTEVERLRLELQNARVMYDRACEDLVHFKRKVRLLSVECSEEAKKVRDALKMEELAKRTEEEEKIKNMEAMKEVEEARKMLEREAEERKKAEINALRELSERRRLSESLFQGDKSYRKYSKEEIEIATDCFSSAKKIGEGGFGEVYKGNINHTPVAVKVLRQGATSEKRDEFLREIEILSQLRHPNMVLLLGACPESSCLVYEYMENGSLDAHIFHPGSSSSLPWFIRFRILFEVACGLAYLHGFKPMPIVHRDLKPANILLDANYVSKIGDVGLAKIMSNIVPDSVTEYRDTVLAGTILYMDPEYYRTGTIRPKSDIYAFGIIALQLLTARRPSGLLMTVERAIKSGSFPSILDKSVVDWPITEAEKLAILALKCSRLKCRDRPDLESEIIPELESLLYVANTRAELRRGSIYTSSHYFCPILLEVMEDPYIAADGFTYEYRAIKAWLQRHQISPVTKVQLAHTSLIPNKSLRLAIQEWKSRKSPTDLTESI